MLEITSIRLLVTRKTKSEVRKKENVIPKMVLLVKRTPNIKIKTIKQNDPSVGWPQLLHPVTRTIIQDCAITDNCVRAFLIGTYSSAAQLVTNLNHREGNYLRYSGNSINTAVMFIEITLWQKLTSC